jgi:DNA-binding MarR family transcriptional regulator
LTTDTDQETRAPAGSPTAAQCDLDPIDQPHGYRATEQVTALWPAGRLSHQIDHLRRYILHGGEHTLTFMQYRVLDVLARCGPCSLRDVALALEHEQTATTRTATCLANDGLIIKGRRNLQRPEVVLELTSKGRRLHRYFSDRGDTIHAEIQAALTVEEQKTFADLLERTITAARAALDDNERSAP